MPVETRVCSTPSVLLTAPTGRRDDQQFAAARLSSQLLTHPQAGHSGQAQVEDRNVGLKPDRLRQDCGSIEDRSADPTAVLSFAGRAPTPGEVAYAIELGFVDELRLVVQPLLLGGGKAFFKDVVGRRALALDNVRTLAAGAVRLIYKVTN